MLEISLTMRPSPFNPEAKHSFKMSSAWQYLLPIYLGKEKRNEKDATCIDIAYPPKK